jgi:transposase InsO family protein
MSIDTLGPFPTDVHGYTHIVVCIDAFTRYVELVPTVNDTSNNIAWALLSIFQRYGAPRFIRSDNASVNTAAIVEEFLRLLDVKHLTITPHNHQGLGDVERVHREITRHLKAIVHTLNSYDDWSYYCPVVQRIINASYHAALGTSPAYLLSGGRIDLDRGSSTASRRQRRLRWSTLTCLPTGTKSSLGKRPSKQPRSDI